MQNQLNKFLNKSSRSKLILISISIIVLITIGSFGSILANVDNQTQDFSEVISDLPDTKTISNNSAKTPLKTQEIDQSRQLLPKAESTNPEEKSDLPTQKLKINQNNKPKDLENNLFQTESFLSGNEDFRGGEAQISYEPENVKYSSKPLTTSNNFEVKSQDFIPFKGFNQVEGVTQNQNNVKVNQSFTIRFNSQPNQNLINNLRFYPESDFDKSLSGNDLVISPKRLKRNTVYTFGLKIEMLCTFEVSVGCGNPSNLGGFTHSISFLTDWKEEYVYGYSHQNRPLIAYIFGVEDPRTSIMLTGGLHGNEHLSGDLTRLKNYITNNPHELAGQSKKMVIIPYANPDGTLLNQVDNSRGVNLNRNWSAYWQACRRCGSGGLSENETSTLAKLTLDENITHLISYHAQWPPNGIIFKGEDYNDKTDQFAKWVSSRTGYPIGFFPETPTVPGDQTVWAESKGIRAIIIEASYRTITEYDRNLPMYLDLIRYF